MTQEQVDTMKQMQQQQRQQQQQAQLESEQRLRQQQELHQTLAKDRVMLIKQQRQRQRPGSWSGNIASFKTMSEFDERPIRQEQQLSVREHGRSLSVTSLQSLPPSTTSSSAFLSKSRTGSRPKSMLAFKGNDQKMRFSTVVSSASSPQPSPNAALESSSNGFWDNVHQGLETHQEE
jgi:hypothetical protein